CVLLYGVVEADHDLSRLHDIAITHQNLANDAAFEMLHGLARSVDHHGAGADDGGTQRRQRRPEGKPAETKPDDCPAPGDRSAIACRKGWLGDAGARPL